MAALTTHSISASTRYCAVYGHPIRHSASPAMHNAALAALDLDWRYLAFEVHPDRLQEAIQGAAAMGFLGLNLTVPHKLLAFGLVDELDETARNWGAVNTIRFEGEDAEGRWRPLREFSATAALRVRAHGFNTDADAITRSIQEELGVTLAGARVLLLGCGGAGRTAALKLASEGIRCLYLVNRTTSKAEEVATELRGRFTSMPVAIGYPRATERVELVINATSKGLTPEDGSPLDNTLFPLERAGAVFDMIYRPAETALLRQAREAGCRAANGLGMLLYQGAKALELWTGQNPPIEVMRDALWKNIYGG